jgi:hypothetical protein
MVRPAAGPCFASLQLFLLPDIAAAASLLMSLPLQDLPGCAYLASSPNGRPYELEPTLANITHAIMVVMGWVSSSSRKMCPPSLSDLSLALSLSQRRTLQVDALYSTHFLMPVIQCIFFWLLMNQQRSPYIFEYQVSQRVTKHLSALGDDSVMQEIARFPSYHIPQSINQSQTSPCETKPSRTLHPHSALQPA